MIRLVEHVIALSDEELRSLGIQDIALCDLWFTERPSDAKQVEDQENIPALIESWTQNAAPRTFNTEGRRHQTLLRELIDVAIAGNTRTLARDELALLLKVHELACRVRDPEAFERVRGVLDEHINKIKEEYSARPVASGLPGLSKKLRVVNTHDIETAKAMDVRVLAGVVLPSRGPLLSQKGHLRVLGDIPENATLVVEDGDCVVDGFVLGRVAVSGSCEVLENLAGVVIAKNGDVRARNIVNGAFVVSKRGWIHCKSAQGADLIFGGECINIRESAVRVRLFSKRIIVGSLLEGGELHVGTELKAESFKRLTNHPVNIVFRKRLSCRDYGEDPGRQMATDVSAALRIREKLHFLEQQMRFALTEAEQTASNVIAYLLVGKELKTLIDHLASAQRRQDIVHRIILSLKTLYASASNRLEERQLEKFEKDEPAVEEKLDELLDELEGEIDELQQGDAVDESILQERHEIVRVRKDLSAEGRTLTTLNNTLLDLGKKLRLWLHETEELKNEIGQLEAKLRSKLAAKDLLHDESKGKTKIIMLREIMAKIQKGPKDSTLALRVTEPFTSIMLRFIHSRLDTVKKRHAEAEEFRLKFNDARTKVWDGYQMDIGDVDDSRIEMTATGRFDPGIRLLANPMFLDDEIPAPSDACVTTTSADGQLTTFVCRAGAIARAQADAHEPDAE